MKIYFLAFGVTVFFVMVASYSQKLQACQLEIGSSYIRDQQPNSIAAHGLKLLAMLFSAAPFVIVAGLRSDHVGLDTYNYENQYQLIASNNYGFGFQSWLSPGYVLLCRIVAFFSKGNYVVLLFVVAALTFAILFASIYQNSCSPVFSIYLYICTALFFQTMNQSRQMLAISLVAYSYRYIKTRNFPKFLILVLMAASIHASAIIFLPVYPISKIPFNKKVMTSYFFAFAAVYLFYPFIQRLLMKTSYGASYFGSVYDIEAKSSAVLNLLFRMLLFLSTLFFLNKTKKANPQIGILYHIMACCVLIQALTIRSYVFGRVTTYFFIYIIFLLPEIVHSMESRERKLLVGAAVAASFAFYFFYRTSFDYMSSNKWLDYKFFCQ